MRKCQKRILPKVHLVKNFKQINFYWHLSNPFNLIVILKLKKYNVLLINIKNVSNNNDNITSLILEILINLKNSLLKGFSWYMEAVINERILNSEYFFFLFAEKYVIPDTMIQRIL